MEGVQMSDTIILDSKKCNAELLTIHADGRITVAEHLKPTETASKVLQIMREQWMADIQSKKIREQEERIKRLEEMYEGEIGENEQFLGSNLQGLLTRELNWSKDRIKRLEEAGDAMLNAWLMPEDSMEYCDWIALSADVKAKWYKAKEAKL
jgi:hypothetical protein